MHHWRGFVQSAKRDFVGSGNWRSENRGVHASAQDGRGAVEKSGKRSALKTTLKKITIVVMGAIGLG